jgi:lysophospholipase L1-like esterase
VFLGDSITEFWTLSDSFHGKPYVNRGISGQTTPQILLRFRQDVIALRPEVVVILAGTNDIAENTGPITLAAIEDNLTSMVDLAKRNGIRVVLASLLPALQYPWRADIRPVEKIRALNDWMKDYAAKEGLVFLDYHSAMANDKRGLKTELSEDGVHPNQAGYAVMAPLAEKAIGAALSKN